MSGPALQVSRSDLTCTNKDQFATDRDAAGITAVSFLHRNEKTRAPLGGAAEPSIVCHLSVM
jgi:hypothetical protein